MAIYGAFAAPILGMMAQSEAFGTISQNITNMNTGGFKASSTRFSTILASTFSNNSDVGGVKPATKNYISQQGRTISSNNPLDIAINGKGMFLLNSEVDGSGEELYTRDGGFEIRVVGTDTTTLDDGTEVTIQPGYLVDKNGNFVQGWEPDENGNFSTSSATSSIRLDNDAFDSEAQATTDASLAINLPVNAVVGDTETVPASIYDSTGELRSFEMVWEKTGVQTWQMYIRSDGDADPDANVGQAGTTPSSLAPETYVFDEFGHLPDGTSLDVTIDFLMDGDPDTAGTQAVGPLSFALDLENATSIGQSFLYVDFQKDGRGEGKLQSLAFDESGQILGKFTNGVERALYKLPLATFVNPDGLEVRQGNLFAESPLSGSAVLRQVRDPDVVAEGALNNQTKSEFGTFIPFAHELGNTNLEMEFSMMIMTQQAYNSSATVFKTVDEMTKTAADLKSA
jgi:flagellar hook protein FlgE